MIGGYVDARGNARDEPRRSVVGLALLLVVLLLPANAAAHRSGCHRWHSCESDRGTYVCGDLGYCSQCADNQYCLNGRPRAAALPAPAPAAQPAPPVTPPSSGAPARAPSPGTALHSEPATVVRVIDGDTVDVRVLGQVERVRFIGLNTPETKDPRRPVQCFGREASAKAKELLDGKRVELEADPSQGDRDRYGRILRYVFLPDGRNFAEVMIQEGYGHEYTYRLLYKYQERFKAAERNARKHERGLWSLVTCGGDTARPAKDQMGTAPGSALAEAAAPCQPGQVKANRRSGIYHVPGGGSVSLTLAERGGGSSSLGSLL